MYSENQRMTHIYTYLSFFFLKKIFDTERKFPYISDDYDTQGPEDRMQSLFVHSDVLIK